MKCMSCGTKTVRNYCGAPVCEAVRKRKLMKCMSCGTETFWDYCGDPVCKAVRRRRLAGAYGRRCRGKKSSGTRCNKATHHSSGICDVHRVKT